jgi:cysteine desulfurase family protein (TIGR01976 family)
MTVLATSPILADVRGEFPALQRRGRDGSLVIYADAPGGTQVPQRVVDAMVDYLVAHNSNIEGEFDATVETDDVIAQARLAAAAFVGAAEDEIIFGGNMTSLNFNLIRALGRRLNPGDEIIVTQLDHEANVSPWLLLAEDRDLTVRFIGATEDLDIDLEQLQGALSPRTKVVAHTLSSNAVGTVPPASVIADMAHDVGATVWVDAVAFAPHRRINVAQLGCDVLLCSPYKFFGPHAGLAWIRRSFAEELAPERVRPASMYPVGHRFETGTLSHEAIAGVTAAIDYLASLGVGSDLAHQLDDAFSLIARHESGLSERFLAGIEALPQVTLHGTQDVDRRVCTFGLSIDGVDPAAAARWLNDRSIFSWNGNFYAQGVMEHLQLPMEEGILRIGFVHYATTEEVDRVLDAIAELGEVSQ